MANEKKINAIADAEQAGLYYSSNTEEGFTRKIEGENQINLESIDFKDIPSGFQFKKIGDLKKDFSVCNIIGFKDPSGNFVINPKDDTEIIPNCKLIVLGSAEEILKLNQIFGIEH